MTTFLVLCPNPSSAISFPITTKPSIQSSNNEFVRCFKNYFCGAVPVEVIVASKASPSEKREAFFYSVAGLCSSVIQTFQIQYKEIDSNDSFRYTIYSSDQNAEIDTFVACKPPRDFNEIMIEKDLSSSDRKPVLPEGIEFALNDFCGNQKRNSVVEGFFSGTYTNKCKAICNDDEVYVIKSKRSLNKIIHRDYTELSYNYAFRNKQRIWMTDKSNGTIEEITPVQLAQDFEPRCAKCGYKRHPTENKCIDQFGCFENEQFHKETGKCAKRCPWYQEWDSQGECRIQPKDCEIYQTALDRLDSWYRLEARNLSIFKCSKEMANQIINDYYKHEKDKLETSLDACKKTSSFNSFPQSLGSGINRYNYPCIITSPIPSIFEKYPYGINEY